MKSRCKYAFVDGLWEYRLAAFLALGVVLSTAMAVILLMNHGETTAADDEESHGTGDVLWSVHETVAPSEPIDSREHLPCSFPEDARIDDRISNIGTGAFQAAVPAVSRQW